MTARTAAQALAAAASALTGDSDVTDMLARLLDDARDVLGAQAVGAFANIATIVIVQPGSLTAQQVTERIQQALEARTIIEQAKGVLAYTRDLDMSAAYDLLRALAAERQASLTATATATAADVVAGTRQRPGRPQRAVSWMTGISRP